ncbi:MAG TPA: GDP-mannose 4,6-dehydratase [Polyangiaceae bacterium]|nr:GDP-mannose 4,6-dehydratase [Polyangiaceae bacterium]
MRVVVTGADGFVGRHLIDHLTECGDDVLALTGPRSSSQLGPSVDVLDDRALRGAIAPFAPDALVNLAGLSSIAECDADPMACFRVNLLGAAGVCLALRDVAPRARLVLIGSGEMYGPVPEGKRAAESDPLVATNVYAAAKVGAEVAAIAFHRSDGLDVVAARPFNHLGPGQRTTFSVPSFARQLEAIRARRAVGVLEVGNLDAVRDFLHVRDVVRAYRFLIEHGASGASYNVCSGEARTIRSIVEELIGLSGVDARIVVDPARVRPLDIPRLVGNPSRLWELGWKPRYAVRDALAGVLTEAEGQMSQAHAAPPPGVG